MRRFVETVKENRKIMAETGFNEVNPK